MFFWKRQEVSQRFGIDVVYLEDGLTQPNFRQIKTGIFADRNCCLHFVIYEIRAMKF